MSIKVDKICSWFPKLMRRKMLAKEGKRDWSEAPIESLIKKLEIELMEFKVSTEYESFEDQVGELVDIANYAMILADRLVDEIRPGHLSKSDAIDKLLALGIRVEAAIHPEYPETE